MGTDAEANTAEVTVDDSVDNPVVDMPSQDKELKPSAEPEVLTKEQAEKLANERHSKLDKRIAELEKLTSRSTKAVEAAENRAKAAEAALAEAQRRAEDSERESLKDSPDGLSLFEKEVKHREAEADLVRQKAEWEAQKATYEAEIEEAKTYRVIKMADEIASDKGVDAALLVSMTDAYTDSTKRRAKMEALAKVLPKKEPGDKFQLPKPPKPDSGRTSGRFGKPTLEQLEKMSMEQYSEYVKERDQKK